MSDDYKQNLKDHSTWMRGLYIVLFTIIYSVTEIVLVLVVVFQFLFVLFTHQTNDKLLMLGKNLSTFIYQILNYMTFNSNERPFPFSDFPSGEPGSAPAEEKKEVSKKKAIKKKPIDDSTDSDATFKTDDQSN